MKLKLNKVQFFQICAILQRDIATAHPKGIPATVVHTVMMNVYKKFYQKAFDSNKKKYSITLTDAEACAWWLFFQQYPFSPGQLYEQTIIQCINNSIHQQYL